jgi:hypothetical protein
VGNFAPRHKPESAKRPTFNPVTPAPRLQFVGLGDSKGSPAKTGSVSPGFWLAFSYLKPGVLLPRLFLRRIDLQLFCPYLTGAMKPPWLMLVELFVFSFIRAMNSIQPGRC